jgi:hypothetical protein
LRARRTHEPARFASLATWSSRNDADVSRNFREPATSLAIPSSASMIFAVRMKLRCLMPAWRSMWSRRGQRGDAAEGLRRKGAERRRQGGRRDGSDFRACIKAQIGCDAGLT